MNEAKNPAIDATNKVHAEVRFLSSTGEGYLAMK